MGYTLDDWGDRDEFEVKVVAKSLNSGILTDSPVSEISIGIDKIILGPPSGNINKNGDLVGAQKITMAPVMHLIGMNTMILHCWVPFAM